jgi:hypothetical protein
VEEFLVVVHVRFITDKEYDKHLIWSMLHSDDPSGARDRAKSMGIPEEQLGRLCGTMSYLEVRDYLTPIVEERYQDFGDQIQRMSAAYQEDWDRICGTFSHRIEQITRRGWEFDEYLVILSLFHPGVSNRADNKVVRWIFEGPLEHRRITAHEILMIHIWSILDEDLADYYDDPAEEDEKEHLWALNEITTVAILGLEPELAALWSSNRRGFDRFLSNYPQLEQLKMELKEIYQGSRGFQDYLDSATAVLKREYRTRSFAFGG